MSATIDNINLYHAIMHGEQLLVKPEEAADVLRIVEAAQVSSNEKRRIRMSDSRQNGLRDRNIRNIEIINEIKREKVGF